MYEKNGYFRFPYKHANILVSDRDHVESAVPCRIALKEVATLIISLDRAPSWLLAVGIRIK